MNCVACVLSNANMVPNRYCLRIGEIILYFFDYKTEFFFLPKQSQNLDLSYKMDLDLWDCLGRVKLVS